MTPNPAPAEFKHYAKLNFTNSCYGAGSDLLFDIFKLFPQEYGGQVYINGKLDSVCPLSGPVKFSDIDGWVQNQEKQGFVNLWFKNKTDYQWVFDRVSNEKKCNLDQITHKLYRTDPYGQWKLSESYADKKRVSLVGYDHYLDKLIKDIRNYKQHNEFLKSKGENKSLNYLFFGPPRCGKTSMALILASHFDYPIYIMSKLSRDYSLMTPTQPGMKILLFEDFDRYLSGAADPNKPETINKSGQMSDILNSLDGVNSGDEIIRIFTGNDCKIIFENAALINRMSCRLRFSGPTREMMEQKFKSLLPDPATLDQTKLDALLDRVRDKVTMRPFVNYVIRYLFDDDYLDKMIENLDELLVSV